VHHGGDELCTHGCEAICANLGHGVIASPIVSCQVTKHTYQPNFDLWSNVLCPKEMGRNCLGWIVLMVYVHDVASNNYMIESLILPTSPYSSGELLRKPPPPKKKEGRT